MSHGENEMHSGGEGKVKQHQQSRASSQQQQPSTTTISTSSKKSVGVMGSRRIFAPAFKLKVLYSYRHDIDCRGNQRATARKYGIHRRQIQKWLQCEDNLRSSCAETNNNNVNNENNNNNNNNSLERVGEAVAAAAAVVVGNAQAASLNPCLARLRGDEQRQGPPPAAAYAQQQQQHQQVQEPPLSRRYHNRECESSDNGSQGSSVEYITAADQRSRCYASTTQQQQQPIKSERVAVVSPDSAATAGPYENCASPRGSRDYAYSSSSSSNANGFVVVKSEVVDIQVKLEETYARYDEEYRARQQQPSRYSSCESNASPMPELLYSAPMSPQDGAGGRTACSSSTSGSISSCSDTELDECSKSGGELARRRSFSLKFKLDVLDAFHRDAEVAGNQRATARKFNINRRQVQKWLGQENELRGEIALHGGNTRQRLGPTQEQITVSIMFFLYIQLKIIISIIALDSL